MKTARIRNLADWDRLVCLGIMLTAFGLQGQTVDLLKRYPTELTKGDTAPDRARAWEFTTADVFRVTHFHLAVGKDFAVELSSAEVGIGHCSDGAVWAVIIPDAGGKLTSAVASQREAIAHLWLRFHPREISRIFPPDTVRGQGEAKMAPQIQAIANYKIRSSWQAGGRAMIPEPKDLTVDVDTKDGPRRFFVVDTEAQTVEYLAAFEHQPVKTPAAITRTLAEATFDQLWEVFDREYAMFVLRPEIDWAKLRDQYRPKAVQSQSAYEFAGVCADMLRPLRDLHIWLTLAGAEVPVFNRPRQANSNPSAHQTLLGGLNRLGRLEWAVTADKIGFIAIYEWDDDATPDQFSEVLENMRNTRGLIIDVRLNGGGAEPLAEKVAGRFLQKPFVYAYSQFRNGPQHSNLTDKIARKLSPGGPWCYDRPVVLLIGQKCMSSNESFIAMMSGGTNVVIMGDRTCGSSGNQHLVPLPLDMTVSVPKWIDYLPDGMPLDERGFQPQVPFTATTGAFEGTRDDLLTAALERLRQVRLPGEPIVGPAFMSEEKAEAEDASRPRVISVSPADGSKVPAVSEIRIRFDRPMEPLAVKLDWKVGGFVECEFPRYDSNRYEFIIPLHLAPGQQHQLVVNQPGMGPLGEVRRRFPTDGFLSTDHRLARRFAWRVRTQAAKTTSNPGLLGVSKGEDGPEKTNAAAKDSQLLSLLDSIQQKRQHMTALDERVQTLTASKRDGLYVELQSQGAVFKWQQPNQYYGDVTDVMLTCSAFRLGSDGENWWWDNDGLVVVCPVTDMHTLSLCFCDPFGLTSTTCVAAASNIGLGYSGLTRSADTDYHLIEAGPAGHRFRWWVDASTLLPVEVEQYDDDVVVRRRFFYDAVNRPLPAGAFAVPKLKGVTPGSPEALDSNYTKRFVNLRDGSDGSMSVSWGKRGPKRTATNGLN